MADKWIRCIECNAVAHVTDFDCYPQYQCDEHLDEVVEKPMDDRKDFMMQHRHHRMEELSKINGSFISESPYAEPLKVSYVEATNGNERFVIKTWRDDIRDPLQYQLILGFIRTSISFEVQVDEISMRLRDEINHPFMTDVKIKRFIQIVERVTSQMSAGDAMDITAETDTPLVSHCKMRADCVRAILKQSEEIFKGDELKKVTAFVERNNRDSEPMTLLLRRSFTIEETNAKGIQPKKEEPHLNQVVSHKTY